MHKRIYIKDWLALKPYAKHTKTDNYYLKICNEVQDTIIFSPYLEIVQRYFNKNDVRMFSCFLTSYFEDIISETNIWNSFIKVHQELYQKELPFYDVEDYEADEINVQDISFLIWYFLNTIQDDKFISPINGFILDLAQDIMEVFDDAWAYAPENEYLRKFYQIDENEKDYYVARNLIDRLLFKTYLFYPDTGFRLQKKEVELMEQNKHDKHLFSLLNDNRDNFLQTSHTRLLSLSGKQWVAEILGNNHALSKDFLEISKKILGYFLYKGQDENHIFLEHIASGKKFDLTKKSFEYSDTLKEIDTIQFIGLIRWKNEWWFSGVHYQIPFNPDLILDEKKSLPSKLSVNFLDDKNKEMQKIIEKQLIAFKEFNEGSQIKFLPSNRIQPFYEEFMKFYNDGLNLSEEENRKSKERFKNSGFSEVDIEQDDFSDTSENGLLFFNPNSGLEIAWGLNSAFPLESNPYFKEEECEGDLMKLLIDENISTELVYFCVDHCKAKLPLIKNEVGKIYLEDIDFLLRFWKKEDYHTFPKSIIAA